MINIKLPDGSIRAYEQPLSVGAVAADIGPGLAKAALAGKVDGRLVDLSHTLDRDVQLELVTEKHPDALDIIRHSTAHLLAQATQRLFPGAQVTIGPVVDNGFYYDFAYERAFTPDDLAAIEAEMRKLSEQKMPLARSVMARDEAVRFFLDKGEVYKAEIIESIPANEDLSLYAQGEFIDLCRGPHV
ncbi:MAG: TGS domain-containing protein, partial [Xanthomonadales bacterium]|nr:TGS domain-containing protein [Xanthomonadales bacterium]